MSYRKENLIWIDLEMTGLDPFTSKIIEIAAVITDKDLNVLAESPSYVIHQSAEQLGQMAPEITALYHPTLLLDLVEQSSIDESHAEQALLKFFNEYVPAGCSPMCGSSIHNDRMFLKVHMPQLEQYFHYRNIDVSSLKELIKRWAPEIAQGVKKLNQHRALSDVHESIAELQYYRTHKNWL